MTVEVVALILASIALVASGYAMYILWQLKTGMRNIEEGQKALFSGASAKDLESVLLHLAKKAKNQDSIHNQIQQELEKLRTSFMRSLSRVGVIRYNPFHNTGSDQSFSVALLNEKKDGVVITSIFTREGTSVYAKPIKNGTSTYQLTDEEQQALAQAK